MATQHLVKRRDQGRLRFLPRLGEVYRARTIVRTFLVQDLTLKYQSAVLGLLWTLLKPLLLIAVIALAFSFAFRRPGSNYTLHLLATLLPWLAFSQAVSSGSESLVGFARLLRQFYFPKIIFPLRRVLLEICEGMLSLTMLFVVAVFLDFRPTLALLILPLAVLNLLLVSFGAAALGAVLVVYFRDVQHLITVLLRAWFYVTPIIIPFDHLPESYQPYFLINPMYYILELFDAPISRSVWPTNEAVLIATAIALGSTIFATLIFFWFEDELLPRL